jgi:hypothetical protein
MRGFVNGFPSGEYRELPTWWVKYYQGGRAVRESTGTTKDATARRFLRSREGDVEKGLPITPKVGRVTFEDAAKDIINDYTANRRRSLDGLERRIEKHLAPCFRGRRLASISTADIRAYIAKRKADATVTGKGDDQKTRPVSDAEINHELKTLKRMFSLAMDDGKLLYRPKFPGAPQSAARRARNAEEDRRDRAVGVLGNGRQAGEPYSP